MFEESFLANLAIFAAGQFVAYLYLRTGLRRRGLTIMIGGWILADIALLEKFAFGSTGYVFALSLLTMQAWAVLEVCYYTFARIRRRLGSVRRERERLFRVGFVHYIRNELEPAIATFRLTLRRDPWDLQTMLALATAVARIGKTRQARSLLRVARGLDIDQKFRDAIRDELRRFSVRSARRVSSKPAEE